VEDKQILTPAEVGSILHLSLPSVYQAISANEIPSLRFGRRIVIPKAAFNRMLETAGTPSRKE